MSIYMVEKKDAGPKKRKRRKAKAKPRVGQVISQKVVVNVGNKGYGTKRRTGTQAKRSTQPQVIYQQQGIPLQPNYSSQINDLRDEVKAHLSSVNNEEERRRALNHLKTQVKTQDIEKELKTRGQPPSTRPPPTRQPFLNKPEPLSSARQSAASAFSSLASSVSQLTASVSSGTEATEPAMPGTQRRASSATADFEPVSQAAEPVKLKPANKMGLLPNPQTPAKRGRGRPSKASLAAQDPAQYTIGFGKEEF